MMDEKMPEMDQVDQLYEWILYGVPEIEDDTRR